MLDRCVAQRGAVGVIGSELVKRAAPDGSTILMTAVSSHPIAAALRCAGLTAE